MTEGKRREGLEFWEKVFIPLLITVATPVRPARVVVSHFCSSFFLRGPSLSVGGPYSLYVVGLLSEERSTA